MVFFFFQRLYFEVGLARRASSALYKVGYGEDDSNPKRHVEPAGILQWTRAWYV